MIILQDVTYILPNRDLLFSDINLVINRQDKSALTGNNGAGKSTLLKILAGVLQPSSGHVKTDTKPYYVPQIFGQFNNYSISEALQTADKLQAFQEILNGNATDENLSLLNDDWTIEERCKEALAFWNLENLDLKEKMGNLSGGQKTRVFLAGILIHKPEMILLDEPTNHLDKFSRDILYDYISSTKNTLLVTSHDRTLLNMLNRTYELSSGGIYLYGGGYDFYEAQKMTEREALSKDLKDREKALRKAKVLEKETLERQQKLDARGKKKQEKAGLPTISMNTLRNNAEKSTSKIRGVHTDKINVISKELTGLRAALPERDKMKMDLDHSALHKGKVLITAQNLNFGYGEQFLWKKPLCFQVMSGFRIAITGLNGSGKTTLIKMILGKIQPGSGTLEVAKVKAIYIDQDYSLIDNDLSVYQQVQQFNSGGLQEHELKIRLHRFLFTKANWDKPCAALSGGEKMRLVLCALMIGNQAPDIIALDEPTNNLDMQNIKMLTEAINEYRGTLLVISHDEHFLKQINIDEMINITGM